MSLRPSEEPSALLSAALFYASLGWYVFPCHSTTEGRCSCGNPDCSSPGKHPRTESGLKNATTDQTTIRAWWCKWPDAHIAIRTGAVSGIIAFDFDGEEGRRFADTIRPLPTPIAKTGSGGWHYIFSHPGFDVRPKRGVRPGVDIRGDDGYIVAPPSGHISGGSYEWNVEPRDTDPGPVPPELDILLARPAPPAGSDVGTGPGEAPTEVLSRASRYIAHMKPAISGSGGHDAAWRAALAAVRGFGLTPEQAFALLWREYNPRCSPPWSEKELRHKVTSAEKTGKKARGYLLPAPAVAEVLAPDVVPPFEDLLLWAENAKGGRRLLPVVHNAIVLLTGDPSWIDVLAWNEFTSEIEFGERRPPYPRDAGETWRDDDDTRTAAWLQKEWGLMVGIDIVRNAAAAVARRSAFHPVRSYLDGLSWDGVDRLSSWLEDFCGAHGSDYTRAVGRCWLISAAARIYQPGCKADHVLILEGPQGIGKSSALRTLFGEWFTDEIEALGSKDAAGQLQGAWCVELAELDAMSRSESARVKAWMSKSFDRYRPPYGRTVERHERQCVFAGTVNHSDYLRDESGNRRFWPVRCSPDALDLAGLARRRDDLWAEAVARYRAGEKWWLEGTEMLQGAAAEQDERYQGDPWEPFIEAFLIDAQAGMQSLPLVMRDRPSVTVPQLLKQLGVEIAKQGQVEMNRVARALKHLGWERRRVRLPGGALEWRYFKRPGTPGT